MVAAAHLAGDNGGASRQDLIARGVAAYETLDGLDKALREARGDTERERPREECAEVFTSFGQSRHFSLNGSCSTNFIGGALGSVCSEVGFAALPNSPATEDVKPNPFLDSALRLGFPLTASSRGCLPPGTDRRPLEGSTNIRFLRGGETCPLPSCSASSDRSVRR